MSHTRNDRDLIHVGMGALILLVGVSVVAMLGAVVGVIGRWEPTVGHVTRTTAHLVGILGGVAIVYLTDDVRRKTRGSAMGTSSLLVELGTVLFVAVFVGMEAQHSLGVDVWYFAGTQAVTQAWWMISLAVVMLCYAVAYWYLVREVGV